MQLDSDRKRVLILANSRSGSENSRAHVEDLVRGLRERKLEPQLCWQREDFSSAVERERAGLRCVVSAGGDGTLVETLNRAPGMPVALLPLGTENLVARFWHIERSGQKVAEMIAAGACRRLDLARVIRGNGNTGRLFCLMAGIGFDADVVHRLHLHRRGHVNQWSYSWPLVQSLRRYPYPPIDVEIADTGERLRGAQVFVFNLPRYGMNLPLAPEARGDDGLLNLCVLERPGIANLFRYLTILLRGRRDKLRDFHRRLVRRVQLSAPTTVRLQTDGDPAGTLPATIEVVPAALTLVIPKVPPV